MSQLHCKSVVVGVDGSKTAISAAKWAIDEAISRELPLRLVHVVPRDEVRGIQPADWEVERGEMTLWEADGAVQGVGKCEWGSDELLGPTAAALATQAQCPVAIIQRDSEEPPADGGVIAVVVNDEPDNDEVVHHTMEEGRLCKAIVRQIDRRLDSWVRRYPDVRVELVAAGTGVRITENHCSAIDLAVVGQADADAIASLGAFNCHPIPGYPDCSVLLVRH